MWPFPPMFCSLVGFPPTLKFLSQLSFCRGAVANESWLCIEMNMRPVAGPTDASTPSVPFRNAVSKDIKLRPGLVTLRHHALNIKPPSSISFTFIESTSLSCCK